MRSIASTYARALEESFENLPEKDFFTALEELKNLGKCFKSPEVKRFFLSPCWTLTQKKSVLQKVFDSFKLQRSVRSFLFLLLEKKRWREFQTILTDLEDREKELKGEMFVEVESSGPIHKELKEKLIKKLETSFNKNITLREKPTEKNLIGGLKISAGGQIFDDTLKLHLTIMENQIRRNFYDHASQ